MLKIDLLKDMIKAETLGKDIIIYDSVDSTNDLLKKIWNDPSYNGLVVFARHQKKGRGRGKSIWFAERDKSILCSALIFFEGRKPQLSGIITMATAVATSEAVNNLFDIKALIKWPNDIYIGRKKIAGILIESNPNEGITSFVIGIGINCNTKQEEFPEQIRQTASSLCIELGYEISPYKTNLLAAEVINNLDRYLTLIQKGKIEKIKEKWLKGLHSELILKERNELLFIDPIDIDIETIALIAREKQSGIIIRLAPESGKVSIL